MNNKISQAKKIFLLIIFLISVSVSLHSQPILTSTDNQSENIIFDSKIYNKLHNKYKIPKSFFNNQNINVVDLVDSVIGLDIFGNKFKYMYEYDNSGNIISEISQSWDDGKLVNNRRTTSVFNSDGNRTSRLRERWEGSEWVSYNKFTEMYNANGKNIEELDQDWDGTQWINSSRWTANYDSEGIKVSELDENWDGSSWVPDTRELFSDGDDGSKVALEEVWNGSDWVQEYRYTAMYNENSKFILQVEEMWDGSAWINTDRTSFTYDSDSRNNSVLGEIWINNSWMNEYQYSYTFNSNGLRTSWSLENWVDTTWENDIRFMYTYNENGNETVSLIEEWDGSAWIGTSRETYTYEEGNMTFGIHESWEDSNWIETVTYLGFRIYVDSENSNYYSFLASRINAYYGAITDIELENTLPAKFELSQNYPNPFNPSTTIEFSIPKESFVELKVFNILGKELVTLADDNYGAGSYKVSFDGVSLPSGLYIAQISAGNFNKTLKMMLLK